MTQRSTIWSKIQFMLKFNSIKLNSETAEICSSSLWKEFLLPSRSLLLTDRFQTTLFHSLQSQHHENLTHVSIRDVWTRKCIWTVYISSNAALTWYAPKTNAGVYTARILLVRSNQQDDQIVFESANFVTRFQTVPTVISGSREIRVIQFNPQAVYHHFTTCI